ncbi:hypothetical protein PV10_03332 [Exophiala mesophila]|uniref:Dyp-type peroxidase n=1 Tax=Exophiala mesophila TaxID=212818 RepID=A0A0D1X1R0_EXOME|nr:uncharacterized protein PV10_03332 [Exophiala mesophila]KIV95710.1 hypothetical protein PV10_03332 [Exophiala mesophila]
MSMSMPKTLFTSCLRTRSSLPIHSGRLIYLTPHPHVRRVSSRTQPCRLPSLSSVHRQHCGLESGRPGVQRYLTTTSSTSATATPTTNMSRRAPVNAQSVDAPLTMSATFLVLSVAEGDDAISTVRSTLASVADLIKNVSIRDSSAQFAATVGIGSRIWDRLTNKPRPAELHPFREFKGNKHTAVSTPGDLLFHIRADRRDLCFEFEKQVMDLLGDAVKVEDETVGFRYFDMRDLLGFVDGTANPVGPDVPEAVLVAEGDNLGLDVSGSSSIGGSYVVVQKYLHNLGGWKKLGTEGQESVIGRTKFDNVELDDADDDKQKAHKTLATVEQDGVEYDILRDNMPFGSPGSTEYGTYFIGYSRRLWVTEKMLERMFIGDPPGLHDRILDYSTPVTGSTFFVPSLAFLDGLGDD